ncbi:MAG: hypothetical protein LBR08_03380 [Bacteroidales bacterium]|jgi:hypothetical protein|nr:hypothetical protein [Bacteroidales bacterium]
MKRYKFHTGRLLLLGAILALPGACGKEEDKNDGIVDDSYKPVQITPVSGLRIAWDYSSMTRLAAKGASPEMIRASDGSLVAVYESEGVVYLTRSTVVGDTWSAAVTLFAKSSHSGKNGDYVITYTELAGQPTVIQLAGGDLVAACAVRYQYTLDNVVTEFPAAIRLRRIDGTNLSLSAAAVDVYVNLGTESPAFLQLPDGKLQLYFVTCAAAQTLDMINSTGMAVDTPEQQVAVIESNDEGATWSSYIADYGPDGVDRTWTGARTVASRAGRNNTSPAPALVGEQIVVALADNRTMTYKPYLVRSPLSSNWLNAVRGDTPDREYALYEILPDKYFMGNPDLLALPSGETLLSYETDEGRDTGFELMEVAVGSADAYNFRHRTRPFPFEATEKATGNSLMLLDDHTVLALTGSNHGLAATDKSVAPWYIMGHLLNDLTVTVGAPVSEYPVFVGGAAEANLNAGLGVTGDSLYVEVKVRDGSPVAAEPGAQQGDGVYLYIDAANLSLLDVDAGVYKFWIASTGETARWDGKEGQWTAVAPEGIKATAVPETDGYTLHIGISRARLSGFNSSGIRFGMGLSDYTAADAGVTDLLSLCRDLRSGTWLGVTIVD